MLRTLFAFVATLALLPSLAWSQDPAAAALEGAWVVSVGDQKDRYMIVRGARVEKNEIRVESTAFGWVDGRGKPAQNWKAEIFGDTIKLSLRTPGGAFLSTTFKTDETTVIGDWVSNTGNKLKVRMTRIDPAELAAMIAAAGAKPERPTKSALTKQSTIVLLYVGADDCPSCNRFASYYGSGERLKEITPELADARFVRVKLYHYRDPVTPSSLPDGLKWLIEPDASGSIPLKKRGTPFFAAVVDKRITSWGHGTAALETIVAPAIKRAVEDRRAAQ